MELEAKTLLKAIRAKCLECSGGHREEVERCHIDACPLYVFRTDAAPRKKSLRGPAQGDLPISGCKKTSKQE